MASRSKLPQPRMGSVPENPFYALRREIDDLFSDFFGAPGVGTFGWPAGDGGALAPDIDVSETDKAFEIAAELPGVDEKDIEVTVADGVLTVKGEKKAETEEKGKTWHRVERSYGAFQRSLSLPESARADKVSAKFDKGVLRISVPKRAEKRPPTRKISIGKST